MIGPKYRGLYILASRSAMYEFARYGVSTHVVAEILEYGYDCERSRRAKGTIERCLDVGRKTLKAVVVRKYFPHLDNDAWLITHVGLISRRRSR